MQFRITRAISVDGEYHAITASRSHCPIEGVARHNQGRRVIEAIAAIEIIQPCETRAIRTDLEHRAMARTAAIDW